MSVEVRYAFLRREISAFVSLETALLHSEKPSSEGTVSCDKGFSIRLHSATYYYLKPTKTRWYLMSRSRVLRCPQCSVIHPHHLVYVACNNIHSDNR